MGSGVAALGAAFCAAAAAASLPYCWETRSGALAALGAAIAAVALIALCRRIRGTAACLALLAALALALRLAWALGAGSQPYDDWHDYREMSLGLLRGDWGPMRATIWPWGYPLWLFAVARVFGRSLDAALIAGAVVSAATVPLVYGIARRLLPENGARAAAALYALYPGALYWTGVICSEVPHLFLFAAAALCLLTGLVAPRSIGGGVDKRDAPLPAPGSRVPSGWRGRGLGWWLAAGGALAAAAEFFRPASPVLLIGFACYTAARPEAGARGRPVREVATVLAVYAAVLVIFLGFRAVAAGQLSASTSYAWGANLACGLDWRSGGETNQADQDAVYVSDDPRVVNRLGLRLASRYLSEMTGRSWWRLPVLIARKAPKIWSAEESGYFSTKGGIAPSRQDSHWLSRFADELVAAGQFFHSGILALAAAGLWRLRNSRGGALLGGLIVLFAAALAPAEANDRYHFAAQLFLVVAAAAALGGSQGEPD